jgi:MFS family permease
MYGPSFVTGSLIARFGVLRMIFVGVLIYFASAASALAGTDFINFWLALFFCGIGWNFMYIGATTLVTACHTPSERAKTQATNDFLIFATMAVSSMSSGLLLNQSGWFAVNLGTVPLLGLAAAATLWLMWHRRSRPVAAG